MCVTKPNNLLHIVNINKNQFIHNIFNANLIK